MYACKEFKNNFICLKVNNLITIVHAFQHKYASLGISSEMRNMNFLWIVNLTIYDFDILFDCFDIAAFFYFGATCPLFFSSLKDFPQTLERL